MLRLDLLVLVLFGDADGFLNGLLAADCEPVESHNLSIVNDEAVNDECLSLHHVTVSSAN